MSGYAPCGVQAVFTPRSGGRALVVDEVTSTCSADRSGPISGTGKVDVISSVATLRELLHDLRAEGVEVAGVAARHQPLVGDDLLVDPLGPRVGQVRLQARVRGQ